MKDLTQGPVPRHLATMALPIGLGMLLQTAYYLVDLYFVASLGEAALAGVSAAGNVFFIVLALTQMLGVGTVALVSHAAGRQDHDEANLVFNQAVGLALLLAAVTLALGYGLAGAYMHALGADAATEVAGLTFLHAFIPGLALQFAMVVMGSALRGTGIVKPTMIVQAVTVLLNALLAPVLIAGWGTGIALGVAGAGLASTIATAVGVALAAAYFIRLEKTVRFDPRRWRPRLDTWRRLLAIGLPAGGEFFVMAMYTALVYLIIRDFGAAAQAGFGIGSRLMQAIFLPALAIAFAAAPIAGQNVGAGKPSRVRETFRAAALANVAVMASLTILCQVAGEPLLRAFTKDEAVVVVARQFLGIISWNFVGVGLVLTCSSLFQALGNTWPSLLSSALRLATFALPAFWLAGRPDFQIHWVWYLSIASVILQAATSLTLLRWQFRARLAG
jgi:putative MATE family efflux protein